jgi:branched-subunit amino acid transport protein
MTGATFWITITAIGVGSFLLRFSFLGLIGDRPIPDWLLRHLRYSAVALLPAMVAPVTVWVGKPGTEIDYVQIVCAAITLAVGISIENTFAAIGAGLAAFLVAQLAF